MLKNYFCTTMKTLDVYVQHTSVWVVNFRSRKRHVIGMEFDNLDLLLKRACSHVQAPAVDLEAWILSEQHKVEIPN